MTDLFPESFTLHRIQANGITQAVRVGGEGPPLLLLHGYPQTHACWHRMAPHLAKTHTLIMPDLRGYGASDKPEGDAEHRAYAKRTMAADVAALMTALGHETFEVIGHDRGGRVTHRLCLDHARRVTRAAVLDIVPTHTIFATLDRAVGLAYYHWLFLAQPRPLPETLIGADPDFYLEWKLGAWGTGLSAYDPRAVEEYRAAYRDPACIHATCEDYRAAATVDLADDEADADARIACPLAVLWGANGLMEKNYDVLETWRAKAADVSGRAVAGGHFLPEESPAETIEALKECGFALA
ncbi:alpha/beta hydrolase [Caenispirillum salinarum AK4]|uniref:Alpha/beta hydrolase n=1 Tax=Caenispirillum salinarum AK4 TaxID=1238182 RepID=K9GM84_9PROT|nr:alpha/beta hydrolase [Caenispirillum salinarum]EKV26142.1 alpha/beta hydrolase [Caenispirillum salinarum AK4]